MTVVKRFVRCLPIVATITPATLSVRPGQSSNTTRGEVPFLAYANEKQTITWANFEGAGNVESASAALNRLVAATSSSIAVLPFSAPFPNSSYTLDLYGPALKCENLSTALANNSLDTGEAKSLQDAWDQTMNSPLSGGGWASDNDPLYTAVSPGNISMYSHLFVNTNKGNGQNYSCHLWNTTYTLDFDFRDGIQSASIRTLLYTAPMSIPGSQFADQYAPGEIAYWSIFDSLSNVLAAQV